MKKILKFSWLAALPFCLAFMAPASFLHPASNTLNVGDISTCTIDNQAFQDGEEVTYKVYYNLNFVWIPAGEVVFKVKDFGSVYRLSASGRTFSSYEWFFKVRDQYESYVDKATLLPEMSVRDIREGGYTLYDKTVFDQSSHTAHVTRGRAKDRIKERVDFDVSECMHDILSIIYYARNLNYDALEAGNAIPIKIFMDKEEYPLQVRYKGKESNKKIKGQGKFETIKFSPEVISGEVFEENTEMNVWVSDDENKIPLLIESPVSVGSIKAVLQSYKGLKHEFTAQSK